LVLRNLSIPTQLHAALRKCARHRARRNRSNRLSSSCRVQVRWRTSLSFPALTHAAHRAPEPASRRCRQDRTLLFRSTRANPALRQRPASSRGMGWWRHELSSLRRTKPTCKLARLVKKIGVRMRPRWRGHPGPSNPIATPGRPRITTTRITHDRAVRRANNSEGPHCASARGHWACYCRQMPFKNSIRSFLSAALRFKLRWPS
jgi:hypothetical protein